MRVGRDGPGRPGCGPRGTLLSPTSREGRAHLDHVELGHLVLVEAHGQQDVVFLDEHPAGAGGPRGLGSSAWRRAQSGGHGFSAGRQNASPSPAQRAHRGARTAATRQREMRGSPQR